MVLFQNSLNLKLLIISRNFYDLILRNRHCLFQVEREKVGENKKRIYGRIKNKFGWIKNTEIIHRIYLQNNQDVLAKINKKKQKCVSVNQCKFKLSYVAQNPGQC